jgi:hypothetical protein
VPTLLTERGPIDVTTRTIPSLPIKRLWKIRTMASGKKGEIEMEFELLPNLRQTGGGGGRGQH